MPTSSTADRRLRRLGLGMSTLALAGLVGMPAVPAVSFAFADEPATKATAETAADADAKSTDQKSQDDGASKTGDSSKDAASGSPETAPTTAVSPQAQKQTQAADAAQAAIPNTVPAPTIDDVAAVQARAALPGQLTELSKTVAAYDALYGDYRAAKDEEMALELQLAQSEAEIERAQKSLDGAREQLNANVEPTLMDVLSGNVKLEDTDSREHLLKVVMNNRSTYILDIRLEMNAQLPRLQELQAITESKKQELDGKIAAANSAAFAVEKSATALPRTGDALRDSAQTAVGDWYQKVNAISGVSSKLVFGTGDEFLLEESAFVERWGAAIDKFYEQYDGRAGVNTPLKGQGRAMATVAYKYKIDPRLCAAVSIIESSGGVYCIKPNNAWGWGAADSDPYGGAAGWSSWADAFEAWHNGLANSTTGMATANSVSKLGGIYCSSWDWASKVVDEMDRISALA